MTSGAIRRRIVGKKAAALYAMYSLRPFLFS